MDSFIPIRQGLADHIREGQFSPFDLGVYMFLHMSANYETGMYRGCAGGIASVFGASAKHGMEALTKEIQKSLFRLRERHYINYQRIKGKRGIYLILIHKYEPRVGGQKGTRLNAWKHGDSAIPEYESRAEVGLSQGCAGAEVGHIQEIRSKEVINKNKPTTTVSTLPRKPSPEVERYGLPNRLITRQIERQNANRKILEQALRDADARDDVKRIRETPEQERVRVMVGSIGDKTM